MGERKIRIQDRRDVGKGGSRKRGMQERRDAERKDEGKEGYTGKVVYKIGGK